MKHDMVHTWSSPFSPPTHTSWTSALTATNDERTAARLNRTVEAYITDDGEQTKMKESLKKGEKEKGARS